MLYLNGEPLKVTIFPDKTSQVWKLPESTFSKTKNEIQWDFENEAELFHLIQLQHLLTTKIYGAETDLKLTYLPYGRQDKHIANDATFALQSFIKVINTLNFRKITIVDPHNFDACRFTCQVEAKYPVRTVEQIAQLMDHNGYFTMFCYPDAGALKKYEEIYKLSFRPHLHGEKVRDQLTGNILNYKLIGSCENRNVLIVDDICDGGMTFKILAKDLLANGAKSVVLFVTHGIFSKGLQTLYDSGIQRIYTQDGEASEIQGKISYRRL